MLLFLTYISVVPDPFGIFLQVESFLDDATSKVCLSIILVKLINVDLDEDHELALVHYQSGIALQLPTTLTTQVKTEFNLIEAVKEDNIS